MRSNVDMGANKPALVVFAFNRSEHLRRTLYHLSKAVGVSEFDIHLFVDGPRNFGDIQDVMNVREIARSANFGKSLSLYFAEQNLGLANSVIGGVSNIFGKYQSVIVIEDDLLVHPLFLEYMKEALEKYSEVKSVYSISGYNYPLRYQLSDPDYYLSHRSSSWGWGTWKHEWEQVDWECRGFTNLKDDPNLIDEFNKGGDDLFPLLRMQMNGEIDSWSIRFDFAHFEHRSYSLHPKVSMVENIGFDGTGTHPASKKLFKQNESIFRLQNYPAVPLSLEFDEKMQKRFDAFFRPSFPSIRYFKRFIYKLIRVF